MLLISVHLGHLLSFYLGSIGYLPLQLALYLSDLPLYLLSHLLHPGMSYYLGNGRALIRVKLKYLNYEVLQFFGKVAA